MAAPRTPAPAPPRTPSRAILGVLACALGVRIVAAFAVEWAARRRGELCLFDDTRIYWHLAGTILRGEPYVVFQGDEPHYALRAPGYPLFLAACRAVFGDSTLAVRLVQAALGAGGVWLLWRLMRRLDAPRAGASHPAGVATSPEAPGAWRSVPLLAALVAALEPYSVATSALILSEAPFVPLMLAMLWGLATLWPVPHGSSRRRPTLVALATGLAAGAGVLVRPSWALFVPLVPAAWVATAGRERRPGALWAAALVALGLVVAMAPWWARNARVFGRFVPTALWLGASLYDGLRPDADGSSDMRFLEDPAVARLGEIAQDAALRDAALDFARAHPARVAELAAVKAARYWSPWPNAAEFSRPWLDIASAAFTIPLLLLTALGAWTLRGDARALALLAGPLLYFAALHLVFVSSIRYRIPAAVPAFGLAAAGLARILPRGARSFLSNI